MASPPEVDVDLGRPKLAFRLTRRRHADLSGEGARLVGGRWNSPGRPALYLAESRALAVLDVLVHLDLDEQTIPADYVIMTVELSALDGTRGWLEQGPSVPPADAACREIGDGFLVSQRALALRVPSIIVPAESNFMLNPAHPLIGQARIGRLEPFTFDRRLLVR
jgi:RES domain-containing protein